MLAEGQRIHIWCPWSSVFRLSFHSDRNGHACSKHLAALQSARVFFSHQLTVVPTYFTFARSILAHKYCTARLFPFKFFVIYLKFFNLPMSDQGVGS